MPSALFVHPGAELYGSDRMLISTIAVFRHAFPAVSCTVLLPSSGELSSRLRAAGCNVTIGDVYAFRRSRSYLTVVDILKTPFVSMRLARQCSEYDFVYLNTIVIVPYILANLFRRRAAIVHVHELPTGVARYIFSLILKASRAEKICISKAVCQNLFLEGDKRSVTIHNGVSIIASRGLHHDGKLNILHVGRFNSWKGQGLLIKAIHTLSKTDKNSVRLRMLGSCFRGQERFLNEVKAVIKMYELDEEVEICDFDSEPARHYEWSNVVIVPSRKPEPFGLVAIEAMSAGRAVIAADHGGLSEIVQDGITGRLFTPSDELSLADAIRFYLSNPKNLDLHGRNAFVRYTKMFGQPTYEQNIGTLLRRVYHI